MTKRRLFAILALFLVAINSIAFGMQKRAGIDIAEITAHETVKSDVQTIQEQERIETRERIGEETPISQELHPRPIRIEVVRAEIAERKEWCKDLCGDGICQRFVCMALGCPCPETIETCPEDCKIEGAGVASHAAVLCKRYGYRYVIEKTEKGERGICIMPNGIRCDEWDFYYSRCGSRYKDAVLINIENVSDEIEVNSEEGVKVGEEKLEIVGAKPIFIANIRVMAKNMSREAIRITCRERIRLRDCENLTEEECEQIIKERIESCLGENLTESFPVSIDVDNETKTISIQTGNLTVRTRERLRLRLNQLYIETPHKNISITVIPSVATQIVMTKEPIDKISEYELNMENETAMYRIEGVRRARLLGIIPVELKIRARVNAETGDVINVEKPWWSIFTIR